MGRVVVGRECDQQFSAAAAALGERAQDLNARIDVESNGLAEEY
jgi:hypothetical protein